MSYGRLYGVGAGPGAPDLMTLRAVGALQAAQVLALPRSSDYGASMAWRIVRPVIGEIPGQERLFLTFPMNKDPERLRRPACDHAHVVDGVRTQVLTADLHALGIDLDGVDPALRREQSRLDRDRPRPSADIPDHAVEAQAECRER